MCRAHLPPGKTFQEVHTQLIRWLNESTTYAVIGPVETTEWENLPGGIGWTPRADTTPHFHFCFRTAVKKRKQQIINCLDFLFVRVEEVHKTMEACEIYCLKSGEPEIFRRGHLHSNEEQERRVTLAAQAQEAG